MDEKVTQYTDAVCAHIRCASVHPEIREELSGHIQERAEDFRRTAQSEEDALDQALAAMGDSAELGRRLDRRHRPQTEWSSVQFITGVLINFNLLPTAGVSLPFISCGGAGYIVSMASVGLILSVWRRNNMMVGTEIVSGRPFVIKN